VPPWPARVSEALTTFLRAVPGDALPRPLGDAASRGEMNTRLAGDDLPNGLLMEGGGATPPAAVTKAAPRLLPPSLGAPGEYNGASLSSCVLQQSCSVSEYLKCVFNQIQR